MKTKIAILILLSIALAGCITDTDRIDSIPECVEDGTKNYHSVTISPENTAYASNTYTERGWTVESHNAHGGGFGESQEVTVVAYCM